jgi:hypothetical protein
MASGLPLDGIDFYFPLNLQGFAWRETESQKERCLEEAYGISCTIPSTAHRSTVCSWAFHK